MAARREAEFGPLAEALGGQVAGDTVSGEHAGFPARASKRDPRRSYGAATGDDDYEVQRDSRSAGCAYELTLTIAAKGRGREGSLTYRGESILGRRYHGWRTGSPDKALRKRLIDAGAPAIMEDYGNAWEGVWHPAVTYDAKRGALTYREALEDRLAQPTLEECQAQLDLAHPPRHRQRAGEHRGHADSRAALIDRAGRRACRVW